MRCCEVGTQVLAQQCLLLAVLQYAVIDAQLRVKSGGSIPLSGDQPCLSRISCFGITSDMSLAVQAVSCPCTAFQCYRAASLCSPPGVDWEKVERFVDMRPKLAAFAEPNKPRRRLRLGFQRRRVRKDFEGDNSTGKLGSKVIFDAMHHKHACTPSSRTLQCTVRRTGLSARDMDDLFMTRIPHAASLSATSLQSDLDAVHR